MSSYPIKLFFFHMPGCGACEDAAPHLKEFARANKHIRVIKVDLSKVPFQGPHGEPAPWEPEATPTYVLHRPGRQVNIFTGGMEKDELEKWIAEKLGRTGKESSNGDLGPDDSSPEYSQEGQE